MNRMIEIDVDEDDDHDEKKELDVGNISAYEQGESSNSEDENLEPNSDEGVV